jgi:MinD-like ATPase involved in chromosome partitioning or flagellar assembly
LYVITFYSFKGGVGRTMALVNVAAEFVRRGRKVLVVDFDLEAPGLETYKHLRPAKPHPGIVEYVTEFRRSYAVPNLLDYIYEAKAIGKKGGRLWVMPAGRRDRAYRTALASLDWQRLYKNEDGFLLFEDTKKGWEEELKPDYVLIDSRTGDTDVLGICTRQLPDSVVVMFTPNEQNLAGLESVCRDIRREATEGLKKEIPLHFVAANIPNLDDEDQHLSRHLNQFREKLAIRDQTIPTIHRNETLQMLDQPIFALDRPHSHLAEEYRNLTSLLMRGNKADRDGVLARLKDYCELYSRGDRYESPHVFIGQIMIHRDLDQFAFDFWDDAAVLLKLAECRMLEGSFGSALKLLNRAINMDSTLLSAFFQRAICKNRLGKPSDAAADLCHFLQAPAVEEHDILRSLRELSLISPRTLLDVMGSQSVQGLNLNAKREVAQILAGTPGLLESAIDFLRNLADLQNSHLLEFAWLIEDLSSYLVTTRRFAEAEDLLDKAMSSIDDFYQCIQLTPNYLMACWAATGELPASIAESWLEAWSKDAQNPQHSNWPYTSPLNEQINALCFWRLGRVPEALDEIDRAIKWMEQRGHEEFSCWRFGVASPSDFLDDCAKLRRMIQGEPLGPAFFGPASLESSKGSN